MKRNAVHGLLQISRKRGMRVIGHIGAHLGWFEPGKRTQKKTMHLAVGLQLIGKLMIDIPMFGFIRPDGNNHVP